MYVRILNNGELLWIIWYIDDYIVTSRDEVEFKAVNEDLLHTFEMTNLRALHYISGWKFG
jgi:hypothetical protein